MSAAHLPPAEPPAEPVAAVLERLAAAETQLTRAEVAVRALDDRIAAVEEEEGAAPTPLLDQLRTERRVARNRVLLWTRNVRALRHRARTMGLRP